MTLAEFRLKYRRYLLGAAVSAVLDSPSVVISHQEDKRDAKALLARGARLESLESLGREIDRLLERMFHDLVPAPAPPAEAPRNGQTARKA